MEKTSENSYRYNISKSSLSNVLSEAREMASLRNPSRPYTPRESRSLLNSNNYESRPSSAIPRNSEYAAIDIGPRPSTSRVEEESTKDPQWEGVQGILRILDLETQDETVIEEALSSLITLMKAIGETLSDFRRRAILHKCLPLSKSSNTLINLRVGLLILEISTNAQACGTILKKLFTLSKHHNNDHIFREEGLLEKILSKLQRNLENTDMCLFGVGILKNNSNDAHNLDLMSSKGFLPILTAIFDHYIAIISEKLEEYSKWYMERAEQILIQVTGAIRNAATSAPMTKHLLAFGLVEKLKTILKYPQSNELTFNAVRIMSKMSVHRECRKALNKNKMIPMLITLMEHQKRDPKMIVRISFILGNMCQFSGTSREVMHQHNGLDMVANFILQSIEEEAIEERERGSLESEGASPSAEREDVLTKAVRLLANMSMHQEIGEKLTHKDVVIELIELLERKPVNHCEELILNIVSLIANLSFYQVENNLVFSEYEKIFFKTRDLLVYPNTELILEILRLLGNLSQIDQVRKLISSHKVIDVILMLADHEDEDVVSGACGILINLSADESFCQLPVNESLVSRTLDILAMEPESKLLSTLVLQILFNVLCVNGKNFTMEKNQKEMLKRELSKIIQELSGKNDKTSLDHSCIEVAKRLEDWIKQK
eukprot:gb/GECH01008470.1/.p1 GENE.gb/GECH01008470.1/~~gb/GECH01008470.1/.p1  ORF type:complete len:661 (+),score=117.85 gb/GECH01008470.1/:1-1983(+)